MINLLQFNQIHGKSLTPARTMDQPLLLKLNQFITAKILEIFPDQSAKVLYNGSTLHAKLEAPLIKGDNYLFEVSEKNNTIYLKKVDTDPVKSTSEQILSRWSLPASDLNKKAVEFAIIEKLPLLKENIKTVSEVMKFTNELPLHEKKAVVQRMMELQLPPKQEIVQAVAFSLKSHAGSSNEFKQLYEALMPFIHKDKAVSKTIELLQELYAFKGNESSKQQAVIQDRVRSMDLKNTADIVMPLNGKLPVPLKVQTTSIYDVQENLPTQLKDDVMKVSKETNLNPSEEFITAAKKWLIKSGLLHEKNILLDPIQLKQTETLKSQLLNLQQNADRIELPEIIQQKTEQALNKLTAQQLQNIQSNENMQQFILHIPFNGSENPKEMTVRWESNKQDGKGIDPDHCRMLFWLEMKHLKDVAVDVHIQNRIVSLKVYNSHPAIEKFSEPLLNTLKISMKNMNYTLTSVTFSSQNKKIKNTETSISYKGLDLRI